MYYISEQNERKNKRLALVLTVAFHVALFSWLYLSASSKPTTNSLTSKTKTEKNRPLTP
jgi:membrane protein involved in colicin uptake